MKTCDPDIQQVHHVAYDDLLTQETDRKQLKQVYGIFKA